MINTVSIRTEAKKSDASDDAVFKSAAHTASHRPAHTPAHAAPISGGDPKSAPTPVRSEPDLKRSDSATAGPKLPSPDIMIRNIYNVTDDSNRVFVEFTDRFRFYNTKKEFIGDFSVTDVIRYATEKACHRFLSYSDATSRDLIEKYVCTTRDGEESDRIRFLSHLESPFTGSLEMLLKLYNGIEEFGGNQMDVQILRLDDKGDATKVTKVFKQLNYQLLNHILRIISHLSSQVTDEKVQQKLLRYSSGIVYKLSKFMKDEIKHNLEEIQDLKKSVDRLSESKDSLTNRIQQIEAIVTVVQQGGGRFETDSYSTRSDTYGSDTYGSDTYGSDTYGSDTRESSTYSSTYDSTDSDTYSNTYSRSYTISSYSDSTSLSGAKAGAKADAKTDAKTDVKTSVSHPQNSEAFGEHGFYPDTGSSRGNVPYLTTPEKDTMSHVSAIHDI